jgi:hypothetical protein
MGRWDARGMIKVGSVGQMSRVEGDCGVGYSENGVSVR